MEEWMLQKAFTEFFLCDNQYSIQQGIPFEECEVWNCRHKKVKSYTSYLYCLCNLLYL